MTFSQDEVILKEMGAVFNEDIKISKVTSDSFYCTSFGAEVSLPIETILAYRYNFRNYSDYHIPNPSDSLFLKALLVNSATFKITKQDFAERYGTNDTILTLIDLFFNKSKTGLIKIIATPIIEYAILMTAIPIIIVSSAIGWDPVSVTVFVFALASVPTSIKIIVSGVHQRKEYTREALYRTIICYQYTNTIPEGLKKDFDRRMRKKHKSI